MLEIDRELLGQIAYGQQNWAENWGDLSEVEKAEWIELAEVVAVEVAKDYEKELAHRQKVEKYLNLRILRLTEVIDEQRQQCRILQDKISRLQTENQQLKEALGTVNAACKNLSSRKTCSHPETIRAIGEIAHNAQQEESHAES